ncbi:MAG TPA: tail fiber protein [Usitatibacter sp.]|nr:tail fiber protein [Usitatibacter sp.]
MDPFTGEIRIFGGNFAPQNWMLCNGASLPISQYQELYALIGTTYGGDGQQTFNLPNLCGRIPVGAGQAPGMQSYALGQQGGLDSVPLADVNHPQHTHLAYAVTDAATQSTAKGAMLASSTAVSIYAQRSAGTALSGSSIAPSAGKALAHENRMPSLTLTYIICVNGIFPSRP